LGIGPHYRTASEGDNVFRTCDSQALAVATDVDVVIWALRLTEQ